MSSTSSNSKKRANLCVPYVPMELKSREDVSSMMSSTLPMVAMFFRNKLIGWSALLITIQSWLNETEASNSDSSQPGWLKVVMSFAGLMVCYMDLFFPAQSIMGAISSSTSGSGGSVTTRLSMAPRATAA
ncbi:hypothetical protein V1517DRAFT_327312 [Lipomyces orientalis]|uniref:Uncharacterized protein n=1 Tax=Lipomyces orientalis TaxID=1233043 RepID=A0ACC3TJ14_9ASCO